MFNGIQLFWITLFGFLYYFLDPIARLFCRRNSCRKTNKSVLIVRTDSIGDFIIWLNAAKELRKLYPPPEYTITLLANKDWADLAKPYSYWDEIIAIDRNQFVWKVSYRWCFLRMIAGRHFDIAVHPIFSRIMLLGDSIVRVSAAKERIGWELYKDLNSPFFFYCKKLLTKFWYTRLVTLDRSQLMELQKNAQFLRALGLKDFQSNVPRMLLPIDENPVTSTSIENDYFVVVPDAGWEGREWPLSYFMDISRRFKKSTGWQPVFMGANKNLQNTVAQKENELGILNLIGKTGISDFTRIIAKAKCVIGNESSAIHIACACGVPSFCIAGGGHWGRFVPYVCDLKNDCKPVMIYQMMDCYRCEWFCRYPRAKGDPVKCIKDIDTEQAWKTIVSTLQLNV